MNESDLQIMVADYLRLQYPDVLFHSDFGSGIKLTIGQAAKQKRQNGGRRSWPDMFIAEPIYEEVEQWKDIKGYENIYKISDHARVKRVNNSEEHFIKTQINQRNNYCYVHLSKGGKVKAYRIHRLVAEHFIDKPIGKNHVNHIDGDKTNNMYSNLEWTTPSSNQIHRYRVLGKEGGGRPNIRIKCVETGAIYKSIAEAARRTGIKHIPSVIRGERQTAGGYRWQKL
jgi:hypothetical protein